MANNIIFIYSNYCCIKFQVIGDVDSGVIGFGTFQVVANGSNAYGYDFVRARQDKYFGAYADEGTYHISSLTIDGDEQISGTPTEFEFDMFDIQTNHIVVVTFAAD